jgi:hypothetical protein
LIAILNKRRTNIFNGEQAATATTTATEEDFLVGLFHSSMDTYIKDAIKYIHYCSFFFFGTFQLVSVMLYIHICCFVQGYADHLADAMKVIVMSSARSSEKRNWPSYRDPDHFDIRYIATMHQFIIGFD